MAKFVATPLASSYGSVAAINANLAAIEAAFQNTVSRDGSSPNAMTTALDMNGQSILNVNELNTATLTIGGGSIQSSIDAAVVSATAVATAQAAIATTQASNALTSANNSASSANTAFTYATNASNSAAAAAISASSASSSASSATNAAALALSYTMVGFGGTVLDLGFVTDPTIYFPTDLGVLV